MKHQMTRFRIGVAVLGLLALASAVPGLGALAQSPSPCSSSVATPADPSGSPMAAGDLTVFAAASLAQPFADLQAPWAARHPDSGLVFSFDASSTLRAQIEQGAPADVLASADVTNPQALVDACLAPGPITPFAANRLIIVVPVSNPAGIVAAADLARPGVAVVAAGPDVPITRYATQVIANLAAQPGFPADFAAAVAANTVSQEDNVKAVLAKIELGEGDAAIVYVTDAAASTAVETIPIPDETNVSATYAAVAVAGTPRAALASDFLGFLAGPDAQAVLSGYGFLPPPPP